MRIHLNKNLNSILEIYKNINLIIIDINSNSNSIMIQSKHLELGKEFVNKKIAPCP